MRNSFYLLAILICYSLQTMGQTNKKDSVEAFLDGLKIEYQVSLIKVLANPEKYHGKTIQVNGYFYYDFETQRLFLHKDDFDNFMAENSFAVHFAMSPQPGKNLKNYSNKYVQIIGTYDMFDTKRSVNGILKNIIRLDDWTDYFENYKKSTNH